MTTGKKNHTLTEGGAGGGGTGRNRSLGRRWHRALSLTSGTLQERVDIRPKSSPGLLFLSREYAQGRGIADSGQGGVLLRVIRGLDHGQELIRPRNPENVIGWDDHFGSRRLGGVGPAARGPLGTRRGSCRSRRT